MTKELYVFFCSCSSRGDPIAMTLDCTLGKDIGVEGLSIEAHSAII